MSKNKFFSNMSGKGYYIALVLCAAAIGISGYLYYRNANQEKSLAEAPSSYQDDIQQGHVPAVATQPSTAHKNPTEPSEKTPKDGKDSMKTSAPVVGKTVTEYAMDCLVYNGTTRDWRVHNGIDITAEEGTKVCAAADGTVYTVYDDESMGTTVVIRHQNGYTTKYASLAKEVTVKPGDAVKAGQQIGSVGQTALLESALGSHLHFSVSCDGKSVNPSEFLKLS